MNIQSDNITKSPLISTVALAVMLFGGFIISAEAAPYQDYFTDTTSDSSFIEWITGKDGALFAECDSFNTVFSESCKSRNSDINSSFMAAVGIVLSGNNQNQNFESDEVQNNTSSTVTSPSVSVLDQRCVDNSGVTELIFENVDSYKLTLGGDVYKLADLRDEEINFLTFTDLPDGSYVMHVYNTGSEDTDNFDVDCDNGGGGGGPSSPDELEGYCSAFPAEPEINETVLWEVSASGGEDSYTFDWSGDVVSDDSVVEKSFSNAGEKEAFATISSGTDFITTRCSVDVQDGTPDDEVSNPSIRTIEEF